MAETANTLISKRDYRRLLADLRRVIAAGRAQAEEAVARQLVRTYHALGTRILAAGIIPTQGPTNKVFAELADELDLQPKVLRQAVLFASSYAQPPSDAFRLRWAHYRELISVKDPATRGWYQTRANESGWTYRQLAQAIRQGAHQHQHGTIPTVAAALLRPQEATYVYKAKVERIVDGDTLILRIDLGFDVLKRHRIRLARLDTPPLKDPMGQKARGYLSQALAQVDFVVVKTNKVDLYGRYVGHIFYAPNIADEHRVFSEGRYLNAELVEQGLASVL